MYTKHFFALVILSASSTLYGAAGWVDHVSKTSDPFITAKNAIHNDNAELFMDTLRRNPLLVHYLHNPSTDKTLQTLQLQHVDLLKVAIGTLKEDRTFFVIQLLNHYKAKISSMHIASCIAALPNRSHNPTGSTDFFYIERCTLTNLTKLFYNLGDHMLAGAEIPAQKALQAAVQDFIGSSRGTLGNISELLSAVTLQTTAYNSRR